MPTVHLVRHALPAWDRAVQLGWTGPAVDLVPLAAQGIEQAARLAGELAALGASLVVSSPMPRALQTAAIVALANRWELAVELDLREWLPHVGLQWRDLDDVHRARADMLAAGDGAEPRAPFAWEPLAAVRARSLAALRPHTAAHRTVIAVCHEVVICALTGHHRTPHAARRVLELD